MKYIIKIMLCFSLLFAVTACDDDDEVPVVYEEVNYATLNGTWTLTEWNGEALEEGQYVYITFNRREHTFEMYENMGSMYSHKTTGTFEVEEDDELGYIISGQYDYSGNEWAEYIVSEMTDTTMKWTNVDDESDVCIYTRCDEVPEDIVSGSRSL